MLVWCAILFTLGIMAFMDSLYNYGEIFRQVNSVVFMLVSLGLLIRSTTKMRLKLSRRSCTRREAMLIRLRETRPRRDRGRMSASDRHGIDSSIELVWAAAVGRPPLFPSGIRALPAAASGAGRFPPPVTP